MKLTIDYETRSLCDLPSHGAWVYSKHPSTEVFCLSIKVDDEDRGVWLSDLSLRLLGPLASSLPVIHTEEAQAIILAADEIEAHNVSFEFSVYENIFRPAGWPEIPLTKWRDSMAEARACSLPAGLGPLAAVLGVGEQKDKAGHDLMRKMCKPRRVLKADLAAGYAPDAVLWHETPEQVRDLCLYCMQDTRAEHAVSKVLPDLMGEELALFHLDLEINSRGIHVDLDLCRAAAEMADTEKAKLNAELLEITGGAVETARQTQRILAWLKEQGIGLPNIQAATVKDFLKANPRLPKHVKRFFEIRSGLGLSSVSKFQKVLDLLDTDDNRVRFILMLYGADTGRWSGKSEIGSSIQPQNLPKGHLRLEEDEILGIVDMLKSRQWGLIDLLYDDKFRASVSCIRPALCAAPGHTFWCADFSAIEGRVLAWLCEEEHILQAYRDDLDLYKVAAAATLGISYEDVTAKLRNSIGKPQELGLGFGGGIGAFLTFGKVVGLKAEDYENLFDILAPKFSEDEIESAKFLAERFLKKFVEKEPHRADEITLKGAIGCDLAKRAWRKNRPKTVLFWRETEEAAINAVLSPGAEFTAGRCTWFMSGKNLKVRLPSGRCLTYNGAHVKEVESDFGSKNQLFFWAVDQKTKRWALHTTHGGRLVENLTQAVARDFLRDAMLRLARAGAKIVLHVHDEVVLEVLRHTDTPERFQKFLDLMRIRPQWAPDIPLNASGWRGDRYKKD